jgi:hypothetical protein
MDIAVYHVTRTTDLLALPAEEAIVAGAADRAAAAGEARSPRVRA